MDHAVWKRHFMKTTEEKDDNVNERAEIRRGQKGAPRILELQNAISDSARACGKAKAKIRKTLPADHPAQVALKYAINQRSLESNPMARFYLHRVVYRCQRKVRALTSIKEAEFVINNPRAPRRKKKGGGTAH